MSKKKKKVKYIPGQVYRVRKKYKNGDQYEGEMLDGKKSGEGVYSFGDGRKYVGEWKNGKREGMGCLYTSEGSVEYRGEFLENRKSGYGVQYLASGGKYEGSWLNNRPHGDGKEFDEEGKITLEGVYSEGIFIQESSESQDQEGGKEEAKKTTKSNKRKEKSSKKGIGGFVGRVFKKKKPKEKVVISYPKLFRRKGHIGYVDGKGFQMENIPDEWLKFLTKDCGVDQGDLEDDKTAKYIMKAVAKFNEKEVVKKIEEETGLTEEEQKRLEEQVASGELKIDSDSDDDDDDDEKQEKQEKDDEEEEQFAAPMPPPSIDGLVVRENKPIKIVKKKKKKTAHIPKNDSLAPERETLFDQIKNREKYLQLRKVKTRLGPPDLTKLSSHQKNDLVSIMKDEIRKAREKFSQQESDDEGGEDKWGDDDSEDSDGW